MCKQGGKWFSRVNKARVRKESDKGIIGCQIVLFVLVAG